MEEGMKVHFGIVQEQQQHSLLSQASWGTLEMKPTLALFG
jgi:hypothetical protein